MSRAKAKSGAAPRGGAPAAPARQRKAERGRSLWSRMAILVFLLPAAAVLLPTTVVLGVMLLPTFVAWVVDRVPGRALAVAVGLMNGAGCIPALVRLWAQGHDLRAAQIVLGDAVVWLWAYAAAGAGWMIFLALPPLLRSYYTFATESRIRGLQRRQEQLRKDWGQGVTGHDGGADDLASSGAGADDAASAAAGRAGPRGSADGKRAAAA